MRTLLTLLSAAIILSGCSSKEFTCGDPAALAPLKGLIEESLEEHAKKEIRAGGFEWDAAKARALTSKVTLAFTDVRTSKKDPSSTKLFCEATLNATLPSEMIDTTNQVRAAIGHKDLTHYANSLDLKFEAGKASHTIEYAAQPTDDGKKVFVESAKGNKVVVFVSELLVTNLVKPELDAAATQKAQAQEAAEAQKAQQEREQQALQAQQASLQLERAKAGLKEANNQINIVWNAASPDFRKVLLAEQRTWLKQRDIECKLRATSASLETSDNDREVIRLQCEIDMTHQRTQTLKSQVLNAS